MGTEAYAGNAVLQAALRAGDKLGALVEVRAMSGVSLPEAQRIVDTLLAQTPRDPPPPAAAQPAPDISMYPEVVAALLRSHTIAAVTALRQHVDCSAAQAAQYIEDYMQGTVIVTRPSPELQFLAVLRLTGQNLDVQPAPTGTAAPDPTELLAASYYAEQLLSAAYDLCDQARDGVLEGSQLLAQLQQRCPGQLPEAYERALNEGWRATL